MHREPKTPKKETNLMEPEQAVTLAELLDEIEQNADSLYIREQIDGKWDSYALSSMPGQMAIGHAFRFIRERILKI
jgi:hypothetical protein